MAVRRLDTPDCAACGSPVLGAELMEARRPTAKFCTMECASWAGRNRGRRRPRPSCEACGEQVHPSYAPDGRWCSIRCRDRATLPPPEPATVYEVGWAVEAACLGVDTDVFFPAKGVRGGDALRLCAGCPVRAACLDYALTLERQPAHAPYGIFGGLSADERRSLVRRRRVEAASSAVTSRVAV